MTLGGSAAIHQNAAARRPLRRPLGPWTGGDGSAARPPHRHAQRLLLPSVEVDNALQQQRQQHQVDGGDEHTE